MTSTFAFIKEKYVRTIRLEVDEDFLRKETSMHTPPFKIDGIDDFECWIEFQTQYICIPQTMRNMFVRFHLHSKLLNTSTSAHAAFQSHLTFNWSAQTVDGKAMPQYCPVSKLEESNCISNGKVVFEVIVCYAPPRCINNNVNSHGIQLHLPEVMKRNEASCDLKIVVENDSVLAHKAFLSMISPIFKAMFTHDTKEAQTRVITITDFDFATVKAAVDLFYGHRFELVSIQQVIGVLEFADKYMVEAVVQRLETWLSENITTNNFNFIAQHAWKHSNKKLKEICICYFRQNSSLALHGIDGAILAEMANVQ